MAQRKMVQSMKTFKTFFEDQEYDVAAKPVGKDSGYEYIGKADSQALAKITRRTHKYGSSADEKIETYLNGIGFNFPDAYRQSFELILDSHSRERSVMLDLQLSLPEDGGCIETRVTSNQLRPASPSRGQTATPLPCT